MRAVLYDVKTIFSNGASQDLGPLWAAIAFTTKLIKMFSPTDVATVPSMVFHYCRGGSVCGKVAGILLSFFIYLISKSLT